MNHRPRKELLLPGQILVDQAADKLRIPAEARTVFRALVDRLQTPQAREAELAQLRDDLVAVNDALIEAGIEYPLGVAGVQDLARQRDGWADRAKEAEEGQEELRAQLASKAPAAELEAVNEALSVAGVEPGAAGVKDLEDQRNRMAAEWFECVDEVLRLRTELAEAKSLITPARTELNASNSAASAPRREGRKVFYYRGPARLEHATDPARCREVDVQVYEEVHENTVLSGRDVFPGEQMDRTLFVIARPREQDPEGVVDQSMPFAPVLATAARKVEEWSIVAPAVQPGETYRLGITCWSVRRLFTLDEPGSWEARMEVGSWSPGPASTSVESPELVDP